MHLHVFNTIPAVLNAFAAFFIQQAESCIKKRGVFNVVLSGGSSPKKLYELLASSEYRGKVAWQQVFFFFGDERWVPADDPRNNALMVEKALFRPLEIKETQIFRINTALQPMEAAQAYQESISNHFHGARVHFDLVMLGLGDNVHTASLFPFTPVLSEKEAGVRAVYLKAEDEFRITMTAPLINQAWQVAFLVFGENKSQAVQQAMNGTQNPDAFPAQLIRPVQGELQWFLDAAAAGNLLVDSRK